MTPIRSLVLAMTVLSAASGNAATVSQLVTCFFPTELSAGPTGKAIAVADFESAYAVGDLVDTGHQLVVAVYSNTVDGVLSILDPEGGGSVINSTAFTVSGYRPKVELLDLDRDARPEIIVTFFLPRGGTHVWLWKWTGTKLMLLAPDENGESDVMEPMFLDVDGDGNTDIVDFHRGAHNMDQDGSVNATGMYRVLNVTSGETCIVTELDGVFGATRGIGAPEAYTEEFSITDPDVPRAMIVINGDVQGKYRASSAIVILNGQKIFGENDFNPKVARLEAAVPVKANNTISTELRGDPDSTITILIMRR